MRFGAVLAFCISLLFLVACARTIPVEDKEVKNMEVFSVSSPVFEDGKDIPKKYSCKGEDINPPLKINNLPEGTVSLALIMDDPDAPNGTWVHWVLFNIPVTNEIKENSVPEGSVQGVNSWGKNNYGGPCPPSGTHRYFFRVYALDTKLNLGSSADKSAVLSAMEGHIIKKAELVGLSSKS